MADFNPRAACRGRNIVHTTERYKDNRDNLGDVLLDLIHYSRQDGISFASELEWANNAFIEDLFELQKKENQDEKAKS